jgi:diguanylate cyclase (GGDEF)-like protein
MSRDRSSIPPCNHPYLCGQFRRMDTPGDNLGQEFPSRSAVLQIWSRTTLKSVAMPGGILLLGVATLVYFGWLTLPLPALNFLYYCGLIGGMLLAWRFHSSRIFFGLVCLFLAQQAMTFFGASHAASSAGSMALQAAAVLIPLNFVVIALVEERGFTVSGAGPVALFLFVQSVIVAVLCWSAPEAAALPLRVHHVAATTFLPGYALFTLAGAGLILLVRTALTRKPADSALFWSLAAFSLSLHFTGATRLSYLATAVWVLAVSIIENSYLLAYHDELTTLPSRRAFNDALLRLQTPFAIAMVDIDHFKRFNDTYGHDTGDEVLRLVAANLARVSGGGQAFRCGGEEFAILFSGKTLPEVTDHLERLRITIASAEFHMRNSERRRMPRGPDRRNTRGRARAGHAIRKLARPEPAPLSVTVSIGVAASAAEKPQPDLVLEAADKALYRAKANGRNRVETAAPARHRVKAAGIA